MSSQSASSEIGTIVTGNATRTTPYIGRFAPSPTGPLHFGSLLAAVASYLEARKHSGQWLLRVEDIDPPREQPGASDEILRVLEQYGFEWDGQVTYQSTSCGAHDEALQALIDSGNAYRCGCSRQDLAAAARGPLGAIYPGTCRNGSAAEETALRVLTDDIPVAFNDGLQGRQTQQLRSESGDFIIFRRDGLIAYHLAVAVDDHLQGITHVVRGIDLMDSTPRQIWLQQLLGYATPAYSHIPVAINNRGQKLSKNTGAAGVPVEQSARFLMLALQILGQNPPQAMNSASTNEIWGWAQANWNIESLQGQTQLLPDENELS